MMSNDNQPTPNIFPKGKQWISALIVSFGGVGVGLCLSWTATALSSIQDTRQMIGSEGLSPLEKSLVASLLFCGALLGCPFTAYTMNLVGRKLSLLQLAPAAILGCGWLTMSMATKPEHLYLGRILTGFYAGGCSVVVPVYVKEISSNENRGVLGSLFLVMICIGKLTSNLLGIFVSAAQLSFLCALQPIIHVVGLLSVADSLELRTAQTNKISSIPMTNVTVISTEKPAPSKENGVSGSLSANWLTVGTVSILFLLAQLCGINVVTFFTTGMFHGSLDVVSETVAQNPAYIKNSDIAMVLLAAAQVVGGLPASLLVDRCGRKTLLLSSLLVMTVSLTVLSGYFYYYSSTVITLPQSQTGFQSVLIPLIFLVAYSVSYCWGIGSVLWIVMAEIVPAQIIAKVSSLVNAIYWVSAFLVTSFYQYYSSVVPLYVWFLVFSGISLCGGLFIAKFLPETKRLHLQDTHNCPKAESIDVSTMDL